MKSADRGRDAREQVPADAEAVQHLGAVDVGELGPLDELARLGEQRQRALDVAGVRAGHRLAVQRTDVELDGARAEHGGQRPGVLGDRLVENVVFEERVGAGEDRLGLRALVGGDAAREEAGVDAEPEASQSIVSAVGRVLPRSICEMYSFEKRSPARSVWVRPAATRNWRRRSPSRGERGAAVSTHSCGARRHAGTQHAGHFTEKQSPEKDSPPKGA